MGASTFLANRYKSVEYFVGLDLKNEPHGAATWGTGNSSTDWNTAAEQAGAAVIAANPNILVFVEGIESTSNCSGSSGHFWGGNLEPVHCHPIDPAKIPQDKLVYSPHAYGPDAYMQSYFSDASFPMNMPAIWDSHFGYLTNRGMTIVPGEWGGKYGNGGDQRDVTWQNAFMNYLTGKHICSSFYWDLNPNSADTGGILQDDWTTPWQNKINLLNQYFGACHS